MNTEADYTSARTYVLPSNGWEVSYPDGRIPHFVERALRQLCKSWTWDGQKFTLILPDDEEVIWKRGETIFIADETRLLKQLPNETFWGFEMFDKGYIA